MPHAFITPINQSPAEKMSDAAPRTSGLVAMDDGSMAHVSEPGSIPEQLGTGLRQMQHAPVTGGTWRNPAAGAVSGMATDMSAAAHASGVPSATNNNPRDLP